MKPPFNESQNFEVLQPDDVFITFSHLENCCLQFKITDDNINLTYGFTPFREINLYATGTLINVFMKC